MCIFLKKTMVRTFFTAILSLTKKGLLARKTYYFSVQKSMKFANIGRFKLEKIVCLNF